MAEQWYIVHDQQKAGPFSPTQLRQLASSGQLVPTDHVWKEGMASWVSASKISGLFAPRSTPAVPTRPPVQQSTVPADSTTSSAKNTDPSLLERAKAGAADLASKAKAAAQLAARQAEKTKIVQITLPGAYQVLGKHLHSQGQLRAEFAKSFETIDAYVRQLQSVQAATAGRPSAQGVGEKAKAMAFATKEMAESKAIQMRLSQAFAELGRMAFEKRAAQSGPDALIRPILSCHSRITDLDRQIGNLEAAYKGRWITPRRLAVAGVVVLVLGAFLVVKRHLGSGGGAADSKLPSPTYAELAVPAAVPYPQQSREPNGEKIEEPSEVGTSQGTGGPQITENAPPDPTFSDVNYSQGPNGERLEQRSEAKTTKSYARTRSGYLKKSGEFIDHGLYIVWWEVPSSGKPGKKMAESNYFEGKPHGLVTEWDQQGRKSSEAFFVHGKQHGRATKWFDNGNKMAETFFVDGQADGPSTGWYADGVKRYSQTNRQGKLHGKCTVWFANGVKSVEMEFDNGEPLSCDRSKNCRRAFMVAFGLPKTKFRYEFRTTPQKVRQVFGNPDETKPHSDFLYDQIWTYRFTDGNLTMAVSKHGMVFGQDNYPPMFVKPTFPTKLHTDADFRAKVEEIWVKGNSGKHGAVVCSVNKWFLTFGYPDESVFRGDGVWLGIYQFQDGEQAVEFPGSWDQDEMIIHFE
jgi:antitoxin component YwqK of YwqJK toxin-antitoxin module